MTVLVKPHGLIKELGIRGYASDGDRNRAIAMLRKCGFNHFVCFRDVRSAFALTIGYAQWVRSGDVYICR